MLIFHHFLAASPESESIIQVYRKLRHWPVEALACCPPAGGPPLTVTRTRTAASLRPRARNPGHCDVTLAGRKVGRPGPPAGPGRRRPAQAGAAILALCGGVAGPGPPDESDHSKLDGSLCQCTSHVQIWPRSQSRRAQAAALASSGPVPWLQPEGRVCAGGGAAWARSGSGSRAPAPSPGHESCQGGPPPADSPADREAVPSVNQLESAAGKSKYKHGHGPA